MEELDTDLYTHIQETPLVDSHEHQSSETDYLEKGPDVLQAVFHHYLHSDLWAAGASREALERLGDASNPDVAGRFEGIREAWERVQFTGYGDIACLIAGEVFGIEEMTAQAFEFAQQATGSLKPGNRLGLLRDKANLDHVQIDSFTPFPKVDSEDPEFFLYDLSIYPFVAAELDLNDLAGRTRVEVKDAASLRRAIAAVFDVSADLSIACKTQHAYCRTLEWNDRSDEEVDPAVRAIAAGGTLDADAKIALGDWGLARCVELAQDRGLPVKIHTGYMAGNDNMDLERIRPSKLWRLFSKYPDAKFVLMHTGYPFGDEIASLAKHYRNVYADLCWAWSIDPLSTVGFVRRMIHTCPVHKLFAFGGDTIYPEATVAFAIQAREGLNNALQAEVDAGTLSEGHAMKLATRYMRENQYELFDLEGTRAACRAKSQ